MLTFQDVKYIMIDNKNNVVAGGTNLGGNNLSKDDLIEALRTVEKENS